MEYMFGCKILLEPTRLVYEPKRLADEQIEKIDW